MLCISLVGILDTKIVHTEAKLNYPCLVLPHPNSVGYWILSMWFQVLFQLVIRQDGGLFQAVHSFG